MNYAVYTSMLGKIRIEYQGDTVHGLIKLNDDPVNDGVKTEFTDRVFNELLQYFNGERKSFTFSYELCGTEFQKKVWTALCDIPYGETRSYKEIAIAIGNEKASRAVGMANNKNKLHIVVPCHRVVGADGNLVGYAGGLPMKEYLLKMEGDNR